MRVILAPPSTQRPLLLRYHVPPFLFQRQLLHVLLRLTLDRLQHRFQLLPLCVYTLNLFQVQLATEIFHCQLRRSMGVGIGSFP